jgi:hypothetical protein
MDMVMMMVMVIAIVLTLVVVGFLCAPFLLDRGRLNCSQDALDRIEAEIEHEVQALRAIPKT